MKNYLTTEKAAKYLGVTPSRVRQFIMEGRLKTHKIGRDHIIALIDIEHFAEHGKKKRGRPFKKQ